MPAASGKKTDSISALKPSPTAAATRLPLHDAAGETTATPALVLVRPPIGPPLRQMPQKPPTVFARTTSAGMREDGGGFMSVRTGARFAGVSGRIRRWESVRGAFCRLAIIAGGIG